MQGAGSEMLIAAQSPIRLMTVAGVHRERTARAQDLVPSPKFFGLFCCSTVVK
jgi:hypothetical protein